MPIADIRRVLSGISEAERQRLLKDHRARLEARLDEVRSLLDVVDRLTPKGTSTVNAPTGLRSWLHFMPHLPVSDIDRSLSYYQEALGFRLAWQTTDGKLSALASGSIELLLLVRWDGDGPPPAQSAYVYVEDPDSLCAEYHQAGATILDAVGATESCITFLATDPIRNNLVNGVKRVASSRCATPSTEDGVLSAG